MYDSPCSCFIIFIIFILVKAPTSLSTDDSRYTDCSKAFLCGTLKAMKYPFWGSDRPNYCGKAAYELKCVNDTPIIEIKSLHYRVLDVSYQDKTITLTRQDYWSEICPSSLINTTIDFTSFNYTLGTRNLTLGYGCHIPLPEPPVLKYPCTINGTNTSVVYAPTFPCNQNVIVPVLENSARELDRNQTNLVTALDKGFALQWYVEGDECKNCIVSNGACGIDSDSHFICYCRDRPYEDICHTPTPTPTPAPVQASSHFTPTTMKRRPDQSPALFPVILAVVVCFPAISCQEPGPYDVCSESIQCGNISLEYPFWDTNRPAYCGHPDFRLTCQSDVSILNYQSVNYRVLDIDTSTQTITVARNDLWNTFCPQYLYNTSYNSTLFNGDNLSQQNVSLYYKCDTNIPTIPLGITYQFSCNVNQSQDDGFFMRTDLIVTSGVANFLVRCEDRIRVPVTPSSAARLGATGATTDDLRSALTAGFNLLWTANNDECNQCIQSNGQCGSNSTSPELFVCYLPEGGRDSSKNSLSTILPIVGAIVAAIGIGIGIFICRQRRKRIVIRNLSPAKTETKAILTVSSNMVNSDTSNFTASIPSYPSSKTSNDYGKSSYFGAQVFSYEELEVATDNFNESRELGDGGFGAVYYGKLIDGREVAVKRLYENNLKRVEQFMNEVEILTRLNHENLVKLYGCTSKRSKELLLVYEYIQNGTVADHLHGKLANSNSNLFTWPVRLNIAIETAEALAYLHKSDIIHRDVKTNNILLDKRFKVKVADFGLSRLFPNDATHVSTAPQGTPGYVDPEYYQCYQLTDKSDVYSFGVVLIELISSLQAVDTNRHRLDINLANMAVTKIQNHLLGELVDKSVGFESDDLVRRMMTLVAELAFRCLQQEKDLRPTMKEVVEILRGIRDGLMNDQKSEVVDIVVDNGGVSKDY